MSTRLRCFLFNDTATTEIYTLSLHDALPISTPRSSAAARTARSAGPRPQAMRKRARWPTCASRTRSEEHTSELQSHSDLVCRLLLEKNRHGSGGAETIALHPQPVDDRSAVMT